MSEKDRLRLTELRRMVAGARSTNQPVDAAILREMWELLTTSAGAADEVVPALDLGCMTFQQFVMWMRATGGIPNKAIPNIFAKHCTDVSAFSQRLHHTHTVDDPPVGGDFGPDKWGYLSKDPNPRGWLPFPTASYPDINTPWENYHFSWIFACKTTACAPDTNGGLTDLVGSFATDIQIDHKGVACIEITSSFAAIGYGGNFAYVPPVDGIFSARHRLCASIEPGAVADLWPIPVYGKSREAWRIDFDPNGPGVGKWTDGDGGGTPGLFGSAPSQLTLTVPVIGPTQIHVTEEVEYRISLRSGAIFCPAWLENDSPYPTPGLLAVLDPVCWRLKRPCAG